MSIVPIPIQYSVINPNELERAEILGQSQIICLKNYFPLILMLCVNSKWSVLKILIQVKQYLMKDIEISEFLSCSYLRWLLEICHYHYWNLVDSMEDFEAWHVYLLFYELNQVFIVGSQILGEYITAPMCVWKCALYKSGLASYNTNAFSVTNFERILSFAVSLYFLHRYW